MTDAAYNEYKYLVTQENLTYVKHLLDALYGHSDPFAEGRVDSIYYDDLFHGALKSCLDGDTIKQKVRIRGYGDGHYPYFHLKTKNLYAVSKIKWQLSMVQFTMENAPPLSDLVRQNPDQPDFQAVASALLRGGEMYPTLLASYYRYRYRINDYRVTLDTNIEITGLDAGPTGSVTARLALPSHVLEIKTCDERPHLPLLGLIKLPQISFSKFALGICLLSQSAGMGGLMSRSVHGW